jgi:hypothetical protein
MFCCWIIINSTLSICVLLFFSPCQMHWSVGATQCWQTSTVAQMAVRPVSRMSGRTEAPNWSLAVR